MMVWEKPDCSSDVPRITYGQEQTGEGSKINAMEKVSSQSRRLELE